MIAIASDHGGYDLKERVKKYLEEKNIPYQDMGCDSKASCDYPVFGHAAARAVADGTCEKGIVICTTGIGISISANKVKGIRCALILIYDSELYQIFNGNEKWSIHIMVNDMETKKEMMNIQFPKEKFRLSPDMWEKVKTNE